MDPRVDFRNWFAVVLGYLRPLAMISVACVAASCGRDSSISLLTSATPLSACSVSLSARTVGIDAVGTNGQLSIGINRECQWMAKSDVDWIGVSPGGGQGDSSVAYIVSANPSVVPRRGTILVNEQGFEITQAAAACKFSLSRSSASFGSSAGSLSVSVTTQAGCSWTSTTQASWIAVAEGVSSQSGDGTVTLQVDENGPTPRSGTVTVANQLVTISQAAASAKPAPGACTFTLSASGQSVDASGGNGSVALSAAPDCPWSAVSNASWLALPAGSAGSGPGTIQFSVGANPAASARSGTIAIAGHEFTVTQAAAQAGPCTFSAAPLAFSVPAGAGGGLVTLTASTSSCAWTAVSNDPWIIVASAPSGSGSTSVSFVIAANGSSTARSGTVSVGGRIVTVAQAGALPTLPSCTFSLSPIQPVVAAGAPGSVIVTASAGSCAWTATSGATWVHITAGASGAGGGTVRFTVDANPNTTSRTATLTIAGQAVVLTQAAAASPCSFSLSSSSQAVAAGAVTGQVSITAAAPTCAWTAASANPWLTITAGASGTGNGTTTYSAAANVAASPRSGTLTVAGQTVTITQAAAAAPQPISLDGKVSGLTGGCPNLTFTLDGKIVKTNAQTSFSLPCAQLKNKDEIAVTGIRQPDGSVVALTLRRD